MNSLITQLRLVAGAAAGRSLKLGEVFVARIKGEEVVGEFDHQPLAEFIRDNSASSVGFINAIEENPQYWLGVIDTESEDVCLIAIEQIKLRPQLTSGSN